MDIESRRLHAALPVFRVRVASREFAYAPGFAVALDAAALDAAEAALAAGPIGDETDPSWLAELGRHARRAQLAWQALAEGPFEPTCLTLYLSNDCQLACSYCFAAPARPLPAPVWSGPQGGAIATLSIEQVHSGARTVAAHCRSRGLPFTVVMHGGGEPTRHWALLQQAVAVTRAVAAAHGLRWWGYIATHGVIPQARARWLAREFDEVGLSCDGPPELQDAQRPTARGTPTSAMVVRTARLLAEEGASFAVRATVTAGNGHRVPELARWLREELGAAVIRFEPAYLGAASADAAEVDAFAAAFWQARQWARSCGVVVETSGVRIDEVHGPFCNPLRNVLQLVPGGTASACFIASGTATPGERALRLAEPPADGDGYRPAEPRVIALRQRAMRRHRQCADCFNVCHCTADCPDTCYALADHGSVGGARCQLNRQLGARQLVERTAPRVPVAF